MVDTEMCNTNLGILPLLPHAGRERGGLCGGDPRGCHQQPRGEPAKSPQGPLGGQLERPRGWHGKCIMQSRCRGNVSNPPKKAKGWRSMGHPMANSATPHPKRLIL